MTANSTDTADRQHWMAVLAKAEPEHLELLHEQLDLESGYRLIRPPENGLVMVRARAGGTGRQFNFGEATVTRCTLATEAGFVGQAYILGRNQRHAMLAALMDARLNDPATRGIVIDTVIRPLETEYRQRKSAQAARVAATKVDFFTMVRGET